MSPNNLAHWFAFDLLNQAWATQTTLVSIGKNNFSHHCLFMGIFLLFSFFFENVKKYRPLIL